MTHPDNTDYSDLTVHVDLVANIRGEEFFLGHADVSLKPDGTLNMSSVADLMHTSAWELESDGPPRVDAGTPLEPNKAELGPKPEKPKGRVFQDDKNGRWFEVEPGKFASGRNWAEAHHQVEKHGDKYLTSESTLRNVYRVIKEVESD